MNQTVTYYGIRHHGPGCAHSLRKALLALTPDCVIIEGPAGAEPLLQHFNAEQMIPPVALLSYCVDEPQLSVFHPFAEFSPEWQAIRWACDANVPVRFMDLPTSTTLALIKEKQDALKAKQEQTHHAQENQQQKQKTQPAQPKQNDQTEQDPEPSNVSTVPHDPLDWLAQAAGYSDGESWWNHMVEERGDGADLFEAIAQAMAELRANTPPRPQAHEQRETLREAYMRMTIRQAQKEGFERIAVICGAWHVPALDQSLSTTTKIPEKALAAADKATLKGLPKIKTQITWVPWTYKHLSMKSGYGAGIAAPGWYEYLWNSSQNRDIYGQYRSVGWYVRIAHLLRERDLDCSSAHLIEAARLAETLAAMRERPAPSLTELNEAALSVICNGDETPMRFIERELMLGQAIGNVPTDVPTVPLQRNLLALQKSLRLKPEALEKELDLDLRKDTDLARSHLLHRLNLLNIDWGELSNVRQKGKGTFHELWRLSWKPQYEVDIIIASRYGHSVESAASNHAQEQAREAQKLPQLTQLIDKVLLANLPEAVKVVAHELQERSVGSADPLELLAALPSLANVYRYGNVRQTDVAQVAHLFDSMLLRAVISLPLAVSHINEEAAEQTRNTFIATEHALTLRAGEEQTQAWRQSLAHICIAETSAALLQGLSCRLLLDSNTYSIEQARQQLSLNLSNASDAMQAAQWLDGFLNRNAAVLLHNDVLWALIDEWLCQLNDAHFTTILPLVRRTFSEFEAADRRDLGQRVKQPVHMAMANQEIAAVSWRPERVKRALATVSQLIGVALSTNADTDGMAVVQGHQKSEGNQA